jgi:peptide/nickel transport system substrate-binding protein
VKLVYPAGPVFTQEGATLLQNLQQQVKEVGINIDLTPANETETFSGKYAGPDAYNGITWYWTSPTAGVLYIVWRQNLKDRPNGNNSSFYNNPELESTIGRANSTLDEAEQRALYGKAQKIVSDNAAAIGLYTQTTSLAWGDTVKGVWIEDSQGEPVFHDTYLTK